MADTIQYEPVTFTAGAPIDVDALNKLQSNIANVKIGAESQIQTINTTVQGVSKSIPVVPLIYGASEKIVVPLSGNITQTISFGNTGFTAVPTMVASLASNITTSDNIFLRATATTVNGGEIEIKLGKQRSEKTVTVNYIALQMKPV